MPFGAQFQEKAAEEKYGKLYKAHFPVSGVDRECSEVRVNCRVEAVYLPPPLSYAEFVSQLTPCCVPFHISLPADQRSRHKHGPYFK